MKISQVVSGALALCVMGAVVTGCTSSDEEKKSGDDGKTYEESWSASYTGGLSGSATGEAVKPSAPAGLGRLTIALASDSAALAAKTSPLEVMLTVKGADKGETGLFEGTQVIVAVDLREESLENCGATKQSVTLTRNDSTGVAGTFSASVLCSGSPGQETFELTGSFQGNDAS